MNENTKWIYCPFCGSKTRIKVSKKTIIINFPLYCPKCKQENLVNIKQFKVTVIKEPDAKTQSR
ncbi:cysteine-rich KTR domain-containing protein [Enterococcus durans]|uniref:cysteine-rich KTR domain-containing protein n=1 Tax=Enterococcus durans TaxID=53345 RepID=UPI00115DF975|nr:cysteine-rich KTR domain-containing protein [Enterococcus durans]EGO2512637.1 conjugal transfer protein [Enterococcus faecalis]